MTTALLSAAYTLRRPTQDDAHALYKLEHVCDLAEYGEPDAIEEDVRSTLANLDLDHDAWLVADTLGTVIAYAGVHATEYGRIFASLSVHPDHRRHGIGTALLGLMEGRAREQIASMPEGARVTLQGGVHAPNAEAHRFVERAGYTHIRSHWRMAIDLASEPPAPQWPGGIVVRTFVRGQDERAVFEAADEAFSDHWGHVPSKYDEWENWTVKRADFDPSLWFLAVDTENGGRIAGFALDWHDPIQGWVGTLGVLRPYRRRGLAQALLHQSFGEFWRRGEHKVVLGVDSQNLTGATRLYQRVGMRAIRQWDSFVKELRPGRDLSVTALPGA
jgi:mycothiol synthase